MAKYTVGALVILAAIVGARPSAGQAISNVDGQFSAGSILTIRGSGFGNSGPQVVLFDDFEKGPNGTIIDRAGPTVGQWDQVAATGSPAPSAYYSNSSSISGNLAFRSNQFEGVSRLDLTFGDQTEVFGCWWIRHEGTGYPHNGGTPPVVNWKTVWLWEVPLGADGGNDIVLPTGLGTTAHFDLAGNRTGFGANISGAFGPWGNNIWRRVAVYINVDQGTGIGDLDFWTSADGDGPWHRSISKRNDPISVPGHTYRGLGMNGYAYASNPDSHPMFDDFYWAVGPAAQARIELGDSADYESCNDLAILVPESWQDSIVTATMRSTQFDGSSPVYVFVVNADGVPSQGVLLNPDSESAVPGAPGRPTHN